MEQIARAADASRALVYAYFDNVTEVLQSVLLREHRQQLKGQLEAIAAATSFEDMARRTAHINHERVSERGVLIERLRAEPAVAAVMVQRDQQSRAAVYEYLRKEVRANFDIPTSVAGTAVELIIGPDFTSDAAGIEQFDEVWSVMMTGAMKELERRYGGREGDDD